MLMMCLLMLLGNVEQLNDRESLIKFLHHVLFTLLTTQLYLSNLHIFRCLGSALVDLAVVLLASTTVWRRSARSGSFYFLYTRDNYKRFFHRISQY
jgi:hypothetical protein